MGALPSEVSRLVAAFRAADTLESIGVLVAEDGFDLEAVRLISAWTRARHEWITPKKPCPDGDLPTARAYLWLVSGMSFDLAAIAAAAGLSSATTRSKMAVLFGAHLLFPDGDISKTARTAAQSAVADRVRKKKKKASEPEPDKVN